MAANILDGNKIAAEIRGEVAAEAKSLADAGMRPGLAVVLVGHNPASEIYVRGKVKSCEEVGIFSEKHTPPETVSTSELLPDADDYPFAQQGIPTVSLVHFPYPEYHSTGERLALVDEERLRDTVQLATRTVLELLADPVPRSARRPVRRRLEPR